MKLEKFKVFLLGIIIYISKDWFLKMGSKWFEELKDRNHFEDRADTIRNRFWKAIVLNISVVCGTVFVLIILGIANFDTNLVIRMIAIIIALSASLGRGGWDIQSVEGSTIIERIDRGMFKISQLGATILLLIVITMK